MFINAHPAGSGFGADHRQTLLYLLPNLFMCSLAFDAFQKLQSTSHHRNLGLFLPMKVYNRTLLTETQRSW